ncbi:MAG TPA: PEP-CTERM sorting domain-containing protein [Fimbriimonas sp.]|nr:PEP-CTERM sorting domain-containing protein [Fimbriimonas sp.]
MNRISLLSLVVVGLSSTAFGYGSYGSSFSGNAACDLPSKGDTNFCFDAPKPNTSIVDCNKTPVKTEDPYCNIKPGYDNKYGTKGGSDCNTNAVPEPASMIALAVGGAGLLRRRKK